MQCINLLGFAFLDTCSTTSAELRGGSVRTWLGIPSPCVDLVSLDFYSRTIGEILVHFMCLVNRSRHGRILMEIPVQAHAPLTIAVGVGLHQRAPGPMSSVHVRRHAGR